MLRKVKMKKRFFMLLGLLGLLAVLVAAFNPGSRVTAATNIFASPVHAGCYIAAPGDCRIHVEPFTIDIAVGAKLVKFQLIAIQSGSGSQTMIHDFRPDVSNPVPASGNTYTPSLVAQDYAATCGKSYSLSLQGSDTSNPSVYNLGLTGVFTCPSAAP
jgi:hypothetical protein